MSDTPKPITDPVRLRQLFGTMRCFVCHNPIEVESATPSSNPNRPSFTITYRAHEGCHPDVSEFIVDVRNETSSNFRAFDVRPDSLTDKELDQIQRAMVGDPRFAPTAYQAATLIAEVRRKRALLQRIREKGPPEVGAGDCHWCGGAIGFDSPHRDDCLWLELAREVGE